MKGHYYGPIYRFNLVTGLITLPVRVVCTSLAGRGGAAVGVTMAGRSGVAVGATYEGAAFTGVIGSGRRFCEGLIHEPVSAGFGLS